MKYVIGEERGERGAKSAFLGRDVLGGSFPPKARFFALSCLVLSRIIREETSRLRAADAHNLEETSRSCVAVSPFLTGNPSKGEPLLGYGSRMGNPSDPTPQVKHLFKTAGCGVRGKIEKCCNSELGLRLTIREFNFFKYGLAIADKSSR
jgi:hypothetical protein